MVARQFRDYVLGDAVAEITLLGIAAQVLERQDSDRRPARREWRGLRRRGCVTVERDGFVEPSGLALRLDAKLRMQPVSQGFVELEGLRRFAAICMNLHQRAASCVTQAIERQQSNSGPLARACRECGQ